MPELIEPAPPSDAFSLRLHGDRRRRDAKCKIEADSENDRELDPQHLHLGGGWLAGV